MVKHIKDIMPLVDDIQTQRPFGKVVGVSGLIIECQGLESVSVGSRCQIRNRMGNTFDAEVVGFRDGRILLMPFAGVEGIGPGSPVFPVTHGNVFRANHSLIGRVVNALGEPLDGKGPLALGGEFQELKQTPPPAGSRQPIGNKMDTGVRALNTFVPICKGQRMGIFSGSGVGKSTLLGMVARYASAEVNVIGLVGERGREVMEFIRESLGEEGLAKSVVVVATGDEPPLMRRQAAYLTMSVAEYFRDAGLDVLLMMDSVTRFAMAQREIGLSAGEPPTTRGYTPSVFSELPRLLERAGTSEHQGAITAIFTVLVEGGDLDEPVADAVRGILDGHIVLDRDLAERGHFPAINILRSVSRAMPACNTQEETDLIAQARTLHATYTNMEEMIRLGAYRKGADPEVDKAIGYHEPIETFLTQQHNDPTTLDEGFSKLTDIMRSPAPPPKPPADKE